MTANLIELYGAVQNEKYEAVQAYLDALDKESANKRLADVAEHYGFPTLAGRDLLDGWRVMLARDLAHVMYDTSDIMTLSQLLRRKGVELI
jgi:hypothetical protein